MSNAGYADEAPELLVRYESMTFESVHSQVLAYFPPAARSVVDIGSGTGRDAAYLAARGCCVIAVEPTPEMREGAKKLHPTANIEWLDDRLPGLEKLLARSHTFDIVMLNAVWMHLDSTQRVAGMRNVARLVHAGSRVFVKLRHGPVPPGRVMYEVSADETLNLAALHGFAVIHCEGSRSKQAQNAATAVTWTDIVLEKTQ